MKSVSPESVGLSSERLAYIDRVMTDFMADDQLPGIITLIQRRGEIAHFGTYGKMDIAGNRPMEADAIFRIYSMTKPITSIAVMMLLEEGKLNLYDPIADYIPAFAKTKVYAGSTPVGMQLVDLERPITVHHLMTHTAGLSYGFFTDHPVEELYRQRGEAEHPRDVALADSVANIAELPLLFQPGTQWRYSLATYILGHLVEVLADMPFADFLDERIFAPLGMEDTGFTIPADKVERLAQIYASEELYNPQLISPDEVMGIGDITQPTRKPHGDGGLVSTVADYLRFANCLLHGGTLDGVRLLSSRTLAWMTSDHLLPHMLPITIGMGPPIGRFGLGFRVTKDMGEVHTLSSVGEFGWSGAAQTYFAVAPAEDMILMFMSQLLPMAPYPPRNRFTNIAYQAIVD